MQLAEFRETVKTLVPGEEITMQVIDTMPINYLKFKMCNQYTFIRAHAQHIEVLRKGANSPDKIYYTRIKGIERGNKSNG